MKQIAILGLGNFGKSVLEELLEMNAEVLIIDKDKEVIDSYKDSSAQALVLDILMVKDLRRILPESIDAVVIDTGERIEASILATSYCKKLNIKSVIVKAETASHAEILELVGATTVIFPNKEAAQRVTKQIFSSAILNYIPVGNDLVIAEVAIPPHLVGKKLLESQLREDYELNLISVRSGDSDFSRRGPNYIFTEDDIGLFSGSEESITKFTQDLPEDKRQSILTKMSKAGHTLFHRVFQDRK
jgi:trk system potassium uptake protein TrkA